MLFPGNKSPAMKTRASNVKEEWFEGELFQLFVKSKHPETLKHLLLSNLWQISQHQPPTSKFSASSKIISLQENCTFVSPFLLMILLQNLKLINNHIETWVWKSTKMKLFTFKVLQFRLSGHLLFPSSSSLL